MVDPIFFLRNESLGERKLSTDSPMWPYLSLYVEKVKNGINKSYVIDDSEKKIVINGYLLNLANRILITSQNVLSIERQVIEHAYLQSGTPKKISTKDHHKMVRENKPYLEDILTSYPELNRTLSVLTDNFIKNTIAFCKHFVNDREKIKSLLSSKEELVLSKITVSEGETHNKTKTVTIAEFTNGMSVVYKPRSLEFEDKVTNLLLKSISFSIEKDKNWILPKYYSDQNHGWVQYKGHNGVQSEKDAKTFYFRMGFLLGFCTAFSISDITSDNLIAHGDCPIPVDFETAFYSVYAEETVPKEVRWNASLTNILPTWTWKGVDGVGVDLSALGALKKQYVSLNLYQPVSDKDGNEEFKMGGVEILPGQNVLRINGKIIYPWHYSDSIVDGFSVFMKIVQENKSYFVSIVKTLKDLRCRYVPRPTATYHYVNQSSLHPTLMRSTKERRDFIFSILNIDNAHAEDFLDQEVGACMNLDIPFAQSTVGSLELNEPAYGRGGYLPYGKFIDGLSNSIEYIEGIDENRLNFEKRLITNSLIAMQNMYEHDKDLSQQSFQRNDDINKSVFDKEGLRDKVNDAINANISFIQNYIREEVLSGGAWLGFHASPGGYFEYSELGDDFYYGLTGVLYGITLANTRLNILDTNLYNKFVEICYQRVEKKLKYSRDKLGGFYFGISSTILPLYLVLRHNDRAEQYDIVDNYLMYVRSRLDETYWAHSFWGPDFLSGAYGTLCTLTSLFKFTKQHNIKELAILVFEKIQDFYEKDVDGTRLVTFDESITKRDDGLLSGVSHGVMGCAYAALYYHNVINNCRASLNSATRMLQWELKEFDKKINNWKDYRIRSKSELGEFAWSHGLPGNYLIIKYFIDSCGHDIAASFFKKYPPEKMFQFENLKHRKRYVNDSLCHGSYGFLTIAKECSPSILDDPEVMQWSNIQHFSSFDNQPLRVRAADSVGLWTGKTGSVLGGLSCVYPEITVPMLPHLMTDSL